MGSYLGFSREYDTIDGQTIPLREHTAFDDKRRWMNGTSLGLRLNPQQQKRRLKRVTRILDAKYDAADLPAIVEENCSHLTARQKGALRKLLQN